MPSLVGSEMCIRDSFHTIYELQNGFGIGWDIAGLDQKQIEKVLSKPWAADGYNFSERIWNNKQKLISEVHSELTQNIMLGADPQKAIDSLAKKMKTSKNNAGRLVMTEEAYFSSVAQKEAFNELDVEQYEICLLYTSDAADDLLCVDFGGRRILKKKKKYIQMLLPISSLPLQNWRRQQKQTHHITLLSMYDTI